MSKVNHVLVHPQARHERKVLGLISAKLVLYRCTSTALKNLLRSFFCQSASARPDPSRRSTVARPSVILLHNCNFKLMTPVARGLESNQNIYILKTSTAFTRFE